MGTDVGRHKSPAGLVQVYPVDGSADADIDIIAIHGLDTRSPDTWTWRDRGKSTAPVNWLQDPNMLPSIVGRARIFTCDWPADMFQKSVPTTLEESAQFLLRITRQHLEQNTQAGKDQPLFFIASCLGGIILIKALELDRHDGDESDRPSLVTATRGMIFLATPFLGTAFKDMPDLTLKAWASFKDQSVSALIDYANEPTPSLNELVRRFIDLQGERQYHVFAFWEARETSLLSKIHLAWVFSRRAFLVWYAAIISSLVFYSLSPWLLILYLLWQLGFPLYQPKQLVDMGSATAQILERQRLDRSHVLMNKFQGPSCDDYKQVASKMEEIVGKIRKGTLLKQADAWIRDKYYTEERLQISRLSGDPLPLDRCYINLTILRQSGQDADRRQEGAAEPSPFSLFARQKVEIPDKTMRIELASIFNQRQGPDRREMQPRRVLIRGRTGAGKTTLCKKIVHEFTRGTWAEWNQLFDRILWVPLRNLKLEERRREPAYDFACLFRHEYFSLPNNRPDLAQELCRSLETKDSKTLFLLDGLDEVSQVLAGDGSMSRFLNELLKQPNAIITSRPSAKTPPHLDLELETIGFLPDQVQAYVKRAFTSSDTGNIDANKIAEVRSFLAGHWLIEGLVRIPIQLDALCYTWDDFDPTSVPNTMTGMYRAIEQKLWKKDAVRLKKMSEDQAESARPAEIQRSVRAELAVLECLAFNGMCSGVIDFTPAHRDDIVDMFPPSTLSLDETLAQLSFLRTSDPSAKIKDREYHFIHLTFQEYFAARYFVRQWKDDKQLECVFEPRKHNAPTDPVNFLRTYKYAARYDVLWRFVAGLLDTGQDDKTLRFFETIEKPPLDLLGPTHQRLVMHCLSEVSGDLKIRGDLENTLSKWLLFECRFRQSAQLASEVEFPEKALSVAFHEGTDVMAILLASLARRAILPPGILAAIAARLEDEDGDVRQAAIRALEGQSALPLEAVTAIAARLEHEDRDVRYAAIRALEGQPALPAETITAIAARLEDEDGDVRQAAIRALGGQPALPAETVKAIATWLEDEDGDVRYAAIRALEGQPALPAETITAIATRLEHEGRFLRQAAIKALGEQPALPAETVTAIATWLEDEDRDVRQAAIQALGGQLALPAEIVTAIVVRLEDENRDVRRTAIQVLGRQSALPTETITAIAARLEHEDWRARQIAVEVLGGQLALPVEAVTAIVARLQHEDRDVRWAAIQALRGQSALSMEAFRAVAARLKDEHRDVRQAAIHALRGQSVLQAEAVTAIAVQLEHGNPDIRQAAMQALGEQSALPTDIVTIVAARLDDEDEDVRQTAIQVLGRQSALPTETITAIAARLEHDNRDVQEAAIQVLGGQSALPIEMVTAISVRLEDDDGNIRRAAIQALGGQSALPIETVTAIAVQIEHENRDIRQTAIQVLGRQSALPTKTITAIAARLTDEEWRVRRAAIRVLGRQSELSKEMVTAITARLEDEDGDVRRAAMQALGGQSALPTETVTAIAVQIEHENRDIRQTAVQVLGWQSALPTETFTAIAAQLEHQSRDVQWTALQALGGQLALPTEAARAVTARLGDEDRHVRRAAIQALQGRSALPAETVTAIAARLEDKDGDVRQTARHILRLHTTLYYSLLCGPSAQFLYRSALRASFEEQQSWYVDDYHFYVSTPEQTTDTLIHRQQIDVRAMISEVQPPNISDLLATFGG